MNQSSSFTTKYSKHIILTLLFFIYNYTYSTIIISFNFLVNNIYEKTGSITHNRFILLSFSSALIIFGIFLSVKSIKSFYINRFIGILTLLTLPLMLLLFNSHNKFIFLASIYLLMFIIGIECVYYHNLMYRAFLCKSHTGIVFSISLSCAILSQYFLQSYTKSYNITLYSLMLITFIAAFINLSGVTDTLTDTAQDDYFDSKSDNKHFITVFISMIFIIILFEYIGNFLSYSLFSLMYDGKALVYDTPRLFIIISYIIMGIFADIKDMKYIPVITLTGVIISILNPVLMHENSSLYANTCIYYIVAGIINSFFTLMMLKLARGRRFAPLIAVSGRIVDGIFSFIFISPIMSNIPIFYAVGIELLCIMVIMLLLAFTGQLSFITNEPDIVAHISPSDFSEKFKLSEKESEVFITALSFDGTMSELAKSLFMSRSVLYRNISNICYKTECDSFQAVKRLYYELPANTQANINTTEIKEQKNDNHTIDKIMSTDNDNLDQNDDDTSFAERMSSFVDKYSLTVKEMQTLKAFLENPYKTQKELADMQGVTLRTIQRHLANIKTKTNVNSFDELSSLFYSS